MFRLLFTIALSTVLSKDACAQQPQRPAAVDVRLSDGLRNDLAGQLIRLQQLGACDVLCHLVIARALVALDTATPVEVPEAKPKEATPVEVPGTKPKEE
jgi:hypothetical protein